VPVDAIRKVLREQGAHLHDDSAVATSCAEPAVPAEQAG
jgi:hypothetical protein